MKRRIVVVSGFLLILCVTQCAKDRFQPDQYLDAKAQSRLIRETVYYATKLPPNSNHFTKFGKEFDWYYDLAADETNLEKYYTAPDGTGYFLMTRVARSINPMREGIGGKVRYDTMGKMVEYEEVFRTWKMPEDSLLVRGAFLFNRMVKGQDLSLYYSKFQGDRYIEFPDDRFVFDKQSRRWRDRELDSLDIQ